MSRLCIIALAFASLLVVNCLAAPKAVQSRIVTVTEKDTKMSLRVGDTLLVRLESTPSTGYGWKVASVEKKLLKQIGEPVIETSEKQMPGATQHQVFKFRAVAAGKGNLELHYVRPWEKNTPPARVYKLAIAVAKPAKK